ncbi:MAG: aminopeptidase N [Kordiimonadaceae bacterium]|nr:aminopeptidase N [Kordiimonadaceae bacterium]
MGSTSVGTVAKKEIKLADYTPPKFTVDDIRLTFQLFADSAVITADCKFRRQGRHDEPLELDGSQYMTLEGIALDGVALIEGSYHVGANSLTIPHLPDAFTLTIITRTQPHENTRLEGLYHSGGNFCTQCEAEGFRHITYFPDRPDILARYHVRIEADKDKFPILLSNGNKGPAGLLEKGRHFAEWTDPHPKPSYLFALVAGNFACASTSFTTVSGRKVELNIYAAPEDIDKSDYAMGSLQRAMAWDEKTFGLEYDLDIYNIVAVSDFNMGAMENKGLNVFNTKYVLASQETATDTDFGHVEGVIGHEYFHNWTGNRVTCRDWFQLSLKEGLTVFRDQEFSSDMGSRALKRIDDVRVLRVMQFSEDAGPLAHSIRPEKYVEINNFYTSTVYNKGAEVIRMMQCLLGIDGFRKGLDLYFERFDGQAVTCEDFVCAMEDATGGDLRQFRLWYSQAGTPTLTVRQKRIGADVRLTIEQTCPATPAQQEKLPFFMPLLVGWLDSDGNSLMPDIEGQAVWRGENCLIQIDAKKQDVLFKNVPEGAVISLLRQFSAPVKLDHDLQDADLAFLMRRDVDAFSRWEAAQVLAAREILRAAKAPAAERGAADGVSVYEIAFGDALADKNADPALIAELITLPSEIDLGLKMDPFDPARLHSARETLIIRLAGTYSSELLALYRSLAADTFDIGAKSKAGRRLRNTILGYLAAVPSHENLVIRHYEDANNMTDRMSALQLIAHSDFGCRASVLAGFYETWQNNALVIDKWFAVQAQSKRADTVSVVRSLVEHEAFSFTNPNRVRSLVSCFSMLNQVCFHTNNGDGYQFLADMIIAVDKGNPQTAAKLVAPLGRYNRLTPDAGKKMRTALEWVLSQENLSDDVCELCERSFA